MSDSRKTVIFVGGTAYSGSTLLDMMLANDRRGFSCGEVKALFRPSRRHHFDPPCGCGNPECHLWNDLKEKGENKLYTALFGRFPNIRFVVDSSKDLSWLTKQSRLLEESGIDVKHVLIWKTPNEIAQSFKKRNQGRHWISSWCNYHRLYTRLIPNFQGVSYASLVSDSCTLENACRYVGIEYFDGKEEYWDKTHHTLFGNTSAKIHTRYRNSRSYERDMHSLYSRSGVSTRHIEMNYRKVHYQSIDKMDPELVPGTESALARVNRIEEYLKGCSIGDDKRAGGRDDADLRETKASFFEAQLYRAKRSVSLFGLRVLPRTAIFHLWPQ